MELFYTVISKEGVAQSKALSSLGGFCSSSKVANGAFDAVFGEVSMYALQSPQPEYIGLILKNTTSGSVSDINIWLENNASALCKLRVAVVELSDSGEMESIPSVNSKPLYAEFSSPTQTDPIEIEGTMASGQMLGIWLERTVNTVSDEYTKRNDCDYLYEQFEAGSSFATEETLGLKISYTNVTA